METGTANKNSNCRVMQALENLSESQVNDFLTGRAPLLLAMKLGEHMMFVQLQLSTSCSSRRRTFAGGNPAHCSNNTSQREKPNCACNPHPGSPVPAGQAPGAIIDSVNHLGQGVYSGTFSGTLDPSLQETTGRPKRDIDTILQILNDLLLASPQLRQSAGHISTPRAQQNEFVQDTSKTVLGETVDQNVNKVEDSLRGKVQTLQKMMQERKLRRQQKRGLKAPYQWSNRVSSGRQRTHTQLKFESPLGMEREVTKTENHAAPDATFSTASATAIEHESVLV
ncbi:midnolin-like isoform X2 [Ruditapes philippinarum]|nr:midnolin-like isoform X2 [Ruditapes philippinarum]